QADATPSNCPQNANTCSNDNPDLPDQVENYMDYSNGACQNMFTLDQKSRMDAVLSGTRSNVWSNSNLTATGVLLPETPCAPKAQFSAERRIVCAGEPITFTDGSYNGEPTTYSWDFPGATPSSSSSANPTVVYNATGVYSVTQTVSNAQGTDSQTQTDYVTVIPSSAEVNSYFSFEGFEETEEDYLVISDGLGNTWDENDFSYSGNRSIVLWCNDGNPVGSEDEFQLPSVNMTLMNDPDLYFRLAYKQKSGQSDKLRVYVSKDCGETWALRYNKSGVSLATVSGTQSSAFTPSSQSDWELINVNLSAYANEEHLLVKFQGTSDAGNNIFIDDIQISGPLGIGDQHSDFGFTISPNPMSSDAVINVETTNSDSYSIAVMDVAGKQILNVYTGQLNVGNHRFELGRDQLGAAGVYLVTVEGNSGRSVKKLVVQ
ncbi:MAG: PKD domain-containing protein, partial [Flavobacteriales bacterium]|nr:PKD domain-containing protein [Flavobacteriales bacterium]